MILKSKSYLSLFLMATVLFSMACALAGINHTGSATQPAPGAQATSDLQPTETSAPLTSTEAVTAAPVTETPAAAAPLSPDDAIKAVQAAWAKQTTGGPRHVSQISYKGDTAIMSIEADSAGANYHSVTSSMGNVVAEQYVFDGTLYNKVQGAWSQVPGGSKSFTDTLNGLAADFSDSLVYADGKVLGVEAVNGKPATMYYYTTTLKGLATAKPAEYTTWVDNATGLPVKRVNVTPQGLKIVQVITYDPNITITLPDEVKNAPVAK